MTDHHSLEEVRAAKKKLAAEYRTHDWYVGVGISPADRGYALRLTVRPDFESGDAPLLCAQGFLLDLTPQTVAVALGELAGLEVVLEILESEL